MANIVVVGPHPDDQELGMGGTIARLADQGHRLLLLDLTNGEPTPRGDPATRAAEADQAARILSAPDNPVRRLCLGLPNRFLEHTLQARHRVAGAYRAHRADVLFLPYPEDAHPDHRAATRIAEDARFDARLTGLDLPGDAGCPPLYPRWVFYYYCTHLRHVPQPTFIMDITGYQQRKRDAILAYRSQFVLHEPNRPVVDRLDASAAYFGSRIGTAAGEPFFCAEPLGLTGLDLLP